MPFFRFGLTALLWSSLLSAIPRAQAQEPGQPIRISVERVDVGVIVTDASGKFVEGLRRDEFHILDNGIEQPLTDFAAVEEPAQVLLLLEAGPAVYLQESTHLSAAYALFQRLSADDRVGIVKYAEAPQAVLDFTADKQAAAAALGQVQFNLGFGSLNLSSSVAKVLDWEAGVRGKKTIVLLSTGLDTSLANDRFRVVEQLKISDVRLLVVSLAGGLQNGEPRNKKKRGTAKSAQVAQELEQAGQLLNRLAEASGGRAYFPVSTKEFSAVYAEIAQLVRHEYSLAFAPPLQDGLVHSIEVRVAAPRTSASSSVSVSYRIAHRRAYLARELAPLANLGAISGELGEYGRPFQFPRSAPEPSGKWLALWQLGRRLCRYESRGGGRRRYWAGANTQHR
jgi:Ca-activated chloride channel family protein